MFALSPAAPPPASTVRRGAANVRRTTGATDEPSLGAGLANSVETTPHDGPRSAYIAHQFQQAALSDQETR